MPKNKVTLFGGAFDPPHVGHQQIARHLLDQSITDEVWFVSVKQHPFGKQVTADKDRLAMLQLILQPQVRVESYELEQSDTSYSAWTLKALSKKYPDTTFSWVIGSDNLKSFHKWGGEIFQALKKHTFFVYPREGYPFEPVYDGMEILPLAPKVQASSSDIRRQIKQKQPVSGLVDPEVERYIKEHNLYQ